MSTVTEDTASPAHTYHSFFGPAIFEPLAARLVPVAYPRRGQDALDIACGTGIVARHLARAVGTTGTVVGVDKNPEMLDVAAATPSPDGAPTEWLVGDATSLELPDEAFDLATCQQGLQFFPDRPAAVSELRRVLRSTGRAVVAVWRDLGHHPLYAALAEAELPHLLAAGVPVTREDLVAPFSLGDPRELGDLLHDGGFGDIEIADHTVMARFPTAARFIEHMERAYAAVVPAFVADPAAFASFVERIDDATRAIVLEHRRGDEVIVPMHALIAIART
jgi:SAM-dependent methyltransferase